jgi:GST-like protein
MNHPTLYGAPGTGSTLVEAMAALIGQPLTLRDLDYENEVMGAAEELRRLNPLCRIPTLVLPGGEVLTESGAIALYLASLPGGERLSPPASGP